MNEPDDFPGGLRAIHQERYLSLTAFTEGFQVSGFALQSVLRCGQTSLDTACRISNTLGVMMNEGAKLADIKRSGDDDYPESVA